MAIDDATLPDSVEVAARKAAKSAHRAMILTMFAVAVAILVLAIDNTIKRSIISEAQQVREIFKQFREATDGLAAAVQDSASNSPDGGAADSGAGRVDEPSRARAAANSDEGPSKPAAAGRKSGAKPGD